MSPERKIAYAFAAYVASLLVLAVAMVWLLKPIQKPEWRCTSWRFETHEFDGRQEMTGRQICLQWTKPS